MKNQFKQLNHKEIKLFKRLNTPKKIQEYLNKIPINFEKGKQTCMSLRMVLQKNRAHCMEAACFAAAVLWFHGHKPQLLDLKTAHYDYDHVVALFKTGKFWGAISKTNHNVLRFRDPIYKTIRELVMSYFHEYFWDDGSKTLRSYSKPFNLSKFGTGWITSSKDLWEIDKALDKSPHINIINSKQSAMLKKADKIETEAGKMLEWKQN